MFFCVATALPYFAKHLSVQPFRQFAPRFYSFHRVNMLSDLLIHSSYFRSSRYLFLLPPCQRAYLHVHSQPNLSDPKLNLYTTGFSFLRSLHLFVSKLSQASRTTPFMDLRFLHSSTHRAFVVSLFEIY